MASTRAVSPRRTDQLKRQSLELVAMVQHTRFRIFLNFNGNNVHVGRTSP